MMPVAIAFLLGVVLCTLCTLSLRLLHNYLLWYADGSDWLFAVAETAVIVAIAAGAGFYAYLQKNRIKVVAKAISIVPLELDIQLNGKVISTISVYPHLRIHAAKTIRGLKGPYRLIVKNSEIIVTERYGGRVSVRDTDGKLIKVIISSETGAKMERFGGIARDDDGNLYVTSDHKLQKFSPDGRLLAKHGKNEGKRKCQFNKPFGVAVRLERVYVCDSSNDRIQVFDLNLQFIKYLGAQYTTTKPNDIAFDGEGNAYVTDRGKDCVQVFDKEGVFLRKFGEEGTLAIKEPSGIHIRGDIVYVAADGVDGVMMYSTAGRYIYTFGCHPKEPFKSPRGIASDKYGSIYVCDFRNNSIEVFNNY